MLGGDIGASTQKTTATNSTTESKQNGFNVSANYQQIKRNSFSLNAYPGVLYAVSKKLHLETGFNNLVSLNYYSEKQENNSSSSTKTKGFSMSSSLSNATSSFYLGFRLFI
jgi:hypothetical protein